MNEEELIADIEQTIKDIEAGETDYTIFDVATDIENISNDEVRFNVMIHFIEQLSTVPATIYNVLAKATKEQIERKIEILKDNHIHLDQFETEIRMVDEKSMEENLKDTVIGKIAMSSLTNPKWDNLSVEDAEKRIEELGNAENISSSITYDSEVAAIRGMATVLGLSEGKVTELIGTRDEDGKLKRDGQIYTQDIIDSLASYMVEAGRSSNDKRFNTKESAIIDMLSVIHDEWIKNNPNNFLKDGRNKEYQFVPLQLLDWEEAKSDLLFLKPILEAGQVEIDEEAIKREFELRQMEFLLDNDITTHEQLVEYLNSSRYLEGLETKNGGNIKELLNNPEIAEKMAKQIEDRIGMRSEEQLITDIIKSDNPRLNDMMWIKTKDRMSQEVRDILPNGDEMMYVDNAISRREYILSRTIGKPYPEVVINGTSTRVATTKDDKNGIKTITGEDYVRYEDYRNEFIEPNIANQYLDEIYKEYFKRGIHPFTKTYEREFEIDKFGLYGANAKDAEKKRKNSIPL